MTREILHPRINQCWHCPENLVHQLYEHNSMGSDLISYETRTRIINLVARCGLAKSAEGDAPECGKYEQCRARAINALVEPYGAVGPRTIPGLAAENTTWEQFTELTRSLPPRSPSNEDSREGDYTRFYLCVGAEAVSQARRSGEIPNPEGMTPLELNTLVTFEQFGGLEAIRQRREEIAESNRSFLEAAQHDPEMRQWLERQNEPHQE